MSIDTLISRLDNLRKTGAGRWIARCPAHDDHRPSLSVRELDDGRILLYDFGGCDTGNVLGALGLTVADLFPKGALGEFKPSSSRIPAADLLKMISLDTTLVAIIAMGMVENKTITDDEWTALASAARRIGRACNHVAR